MLREAYDIDSYAEYLTATGWLTAPQMAELLDVHPATAKRFARQGMLHAVRADDRGTLLFEPPTGPLPVAHPGNGYATGGNTQSLYPIGPSVVHPPPSHKARRRRGAEDREGNVRDVRNGT